MSEPGTEPPRTRREALARERAVSGRPAPVRTVPAPTAVSAPHPAPRAAPAPVVRVVAPARATTRSRIARRLLATGVLLFASAMVVGLSIPANALYDPGAAAAAEASPVVAGTGQKAVVDADGARIPTTTGGYSASTRSQLLAQRYSGGVGGAFHGPVRWPFPYQVAVLSPFGARGPVAGCPSCAPFHRGVDLDGGDGNPIFSIMDGTVTERTGGSWTYGTYAVIVGRYQGHEVKAIYEHMQDGSSPLAVGQHVGVGDFVGLVGRTGEATAPHLHLELDVDGVLTDPIPWLEANAS